MTTSIHSCQFPQFPSIPVFRLDMWVNANENRLTPAWAKKYGYDNDVDFAKHAQKKFSLVETGIVDQPSCRLLLLNGVNDGVTPIEDCHILFNHGSSPKEGRFFEGLPHMGYPHSLPVSYEWLENVLGKKDVKN